MTTAKCLSHHTTDVHNEEALHKRVKEIRERLAHAPQLHLPRPEEERLLDQLLEFDLGRFLLLNRGLNGSWTSYVFYPPVVSHPLEKWILEKSLLGRAPKARLDVFHKEIQALLRPNMHLASLPCGLMDDLLRLDYQNAPGATLAGIDIDEDALYLAAQHVQAFPVKAETHFLKKDAWHLGIDAAYDVISSNGLNMYEADSGRLCALYTQFYKALKPQGVLVMSSVPPPDDSLPNGIDPEDLKKEFALFQDIIQAQFLNLVPLASTQAHLESAGFVVEKIIPNPVGMGPATFIARKQA